MGNLNLVRALALALMGPWLLTLSACQNQSGSTSGAGVQMIDLSSSSPQDSQSKLLTITYPELSGPQVTIKNFASTYTLAIPATLQVQQLRWDFGDGSAPVIGPTFSQTHSFKAAGSFQIKVSILDQKSFVTDISYGITVLNSFDGPACTLALSLDVPSISTVGIDVPMDLNVPNCVTGAYSGVQWNFGDGAGASGLTTTHTFTAAGDYTVSANVDSSALAQTPALLLTRTIHILEAPSTPTPTIPPNPLLCPVSGATRVSHLEPTSDNVSCQNDGSKLVTSRVKITETCQSIGAGTLLWTETSRTSETVSEGPCLKQSCQLPDGTKLLDGDTRTFFSTDLPPGSCADVSQSRTCSNRVLGGSSNFTFLTCNSGCGSFGPSGTKKTVAAPDLSAPLVCPFGETGYFSVYENLADQICQGGQIVTTGTHQGSIKTQGQCPTYTWVPSDQWSQCSANCGGTQTRGSVCVNSAGAASAAERCVSPMPTESRICDGNPDAVRTQTSSTSSEEGNSSTVCPANQIGVIVNSRDVTTLSNFACINHQVGLESTQVVYGPWVTTSYCRDFVAHRCSQDSLDNTRALGRYEWMVRCQSSIPVINDFLTEFGNVKVDGYTIGTGVKPGTTSVRLLYPTFMNHATNPEKPWIAPTDPSAPCNVPSTVYVATVCVSSCATPEQMILSNSEQHGGKWGYLTFLDSQAANQGFVATLGALSSIQKPVLQKTKVNQWVTELVDTDHNLLNFTTKSGRRLRVTTNHPILSSDGSMKLAEDFKTGESLVDVTGAFDPIVKIESEVYFGKVYNLFVESAEPLQNIVVTNGFLNGTAFYQNEGAKNLNRRLLRNRLTRGL